MAEQNNKKVEKSHSGIPLSEKELEETTQCWKDMEDCFNNLEMFTEGDSDE